MSEHIILATLPGQAVSAVTFTAPSEPVLAGADGITVIISPTGLIAQVSPNGLTPAGRRPRRLLSQRHGDALPVERAPSPPRSG